MPAWHPALVTASARPHPGAPFWQDRREPEPQGRSERCSCRKPTAIYYHDGPGRERGCIAGKVQRGLGDFLGLAEALHGMAVTRHFTNLLGIGMTSETAPKHGGVDSAGRNGIDANAIG